MCVDGKGKWHFRHEWTRWSEPMEGTVVFLMKYNFPAIGQYRKCLRCNIVVVKKVSREY